MLSAKVTRSSLVALHDTELGYRWDGSARSPSAVLAGLVERQVSKDALSLGVTNKHADGPKLIDHPITSFIYP